MGEGRGVVLGMLSIASRVSSSPQFSKSGIFNLLFLVKELLGSSPPNLFLDGDCPIPLSRMFMSLTSCALLPRVLVLSHVCKLS